MMSSERLQGIPASSHLYVRRPGWEVILSGLEGGHTKCVWHKRALESRVLNDFGPNMVPGLGLLSLTKSTCGL